MKFIKLKNDEEIKLDNIFEHDLTVFRKGGKYFVRCNGEVGNAYDRIGVEKDAKKNNLVLKCLKGRKFKNFKLDVEGKLQFIDSTSCFDYDYYEPTFYYEHLLDRGYELIESNQDFVVFKTPNNLYFLAQFGDKILDVKKYPKFKSYIELALCYNNKYPMGAFDVKKKSRDNYKIINKVFKAFYDRSHKPGDDLFTRIIERDRHLDRNSNMKDKIDEFYAMELKFLYAISQIAKNEMFTNIYDNKIKMEVNNGFMLEKNQFVELTASEFARRKRYNGYVTSKGVVSMDEAVAEVVEFMLKELKRPLTVFEFPDCEEKLFVDWMNLQFFNAKEFEKNNFVQFFDKDSFVNENRGLIKNAVNKIKGKKGSFERYDKMPISNLRLSMDIVHALEVAGVFYIGDLIKTTPHELFINGLKLGQVEEIINVLAFWGLELLPNTIKKPSTGKTIS